MIGLLLAVGWWAPRAWGRLRRRRARAAHVRRQTYLFASACYCGLAYRLEGAGYGTGQTLDPLEVPALGWGRWVVRVLVWGGAIGFCVRVIGILHKEGVISWTTNWLPF